MTYRLSKMLFVFAAIACTGLRIVLKLLYIDADTGFYTGQPIVALLFNILFGLSIAAVLVTAYREKPQAYCLHPFGVLRVLAALSGIAALAVTALQLPAQLELFTNGTIEFGNFFSTFLIAKVLVQVLSGFVSGVLLLVVAVRVKDGTRPRLNAYLLLVPVLWQLILLLELFMQYTASRSVSDQMITIVTIVFALLFLFAQGRLLADVDFEKGTRQVTGFGLSFAIAAISGCVGILLAAAAGKAVDVALGVVPAIFYLLLGLYAAVLCFTIQAKN